MVSSAALRVDVGFYTRTMLWTLLEPLFFIGCMSFWLPRNMEYSSHHALGKDWCAPSDQVSH